MSDDFLTIDQVKKLTGYSRTSAQRRFLQVRGIPHDINGRGELLVLWSAVHERMGIKKDTAARRVVEPNWDALYQSPRKTKKR